MSTSSTTETLTGDQKDRLRTLGYNVRPVANGGWIVNKGRAHDDRMSQEVGAFSNDQDLLAWLQDVHS